MNALFPTSTKRGYRGSRLAPPLLLLPVIGRGIPGIIHVFLPHGGAGEIAGINLGSSPLTLIGAFAPAGSTQIAHGLVMIAMALRHLRWWR